MKKTGWIAGLGIAAATFALPASAQWYIGAGVGQSTFKGDLGCDNTAPLSCTDTDTAFKLFGGYQVNRNFAAEATYQDFGKAHLSGGGVDASIKSHAFDVSALGMLPFGEQLAAYGRLGVYAASSEGTSNVGISASQSNSGLTYGLGLQWDPSRSFGLRLEYQVFDKVGGGDLGSGNIDVIGLSALWHF